MRNKNNYEKLTKFNLKENFAGSVPVGSVCRNNDDCVTGFCSDPTWGDQQQQVLKAPNSYRGICYNKFPDKTDLTPYINNSLNFMIGAKYIGNMESEGCESKDKTYYYPTKNNGSYGIDAQKIFCGPPNIGNSVMDGDFCQHNRNCMSKFCKNNVCSRRDENETCTIIDGEDPCREDLICDAKTNTCKKC